MWKYTKIYKLTQEKLINNGMYLMNRKPTRSDKGTHKCMDHYYSNRPEKVKEITQEYFSSSDHSVVELIRHMKIENSEEVFINKRNWKDIDFKEINAMIINDPFYIDMLEDEDPDKLANYIVGIINASLDSKAKITRTKIREKEKEKYSKDTRELIH